MFNYTPDVRFANATFKLSYDFLILNHHLWLSHTINPIFDFGAMY